MKTIGSFFQHTRHVMRAACLSLFLVFVVIPAQAQLMRTGENRSFSMNAVGGLKTHYPMFAIEQSLGKTTLYFGIGGGLMGWDKQQANPLTPGFDKDYVDVINSKVLIHLPSRLNDKTYMWKTNTSYSGIIVKGGVRHYFGRQPVRNRMRGLYAGLDMSYSRMYEYQQITYRLLEGEDAWTFDGLNRVNILGVALKTGYNWFPKQNDRVFVHGAVMRPFYIPFQETINLSSPFSAANFEFEIGIGLRIRTH